MSRQFFGVEKGFDVYAENGDLQIRIMTGSAAPAGTGEMASAPIGSLYIRTGTGELYQKIANAGNATDWELNGASAATIGTWRPESVVVLTNDTQAAGTRDVVANPFSDDEGAAVPLSAYVVGKYIIADADGTPSLLEITGVSGNDVTFAAAMNPLVADDTFVVKYYLPDSPDAQEKEAIAVFNGTIMLKVADINWAIADGISLTAGYTAQNGTITSADSVNSAIEKLDGNQQDIQSASGLAQGSTNYGTFNGLTLADNQTSKQLFQRIEDLLEQMRGVQVAGITAAATVDSVPHASVKAIKWLVEVVEDATPANRKALEVFALTNGTLVDDTQYAKLAVGANFNLTITVDISGADMRLRAASSTAGVTVTARRIEVVKTVL
jgi:hypothetical protein